MPRLRFPHARLSCALTTLVAVAPVACEDKAAAGSDVMCGEAKCDDLGELGQALAGFNDPIAVWLRANLDKNGEIGVAYVDMLEAIAKQQGCDRASIDSYVISVAPVDAALQPTRFCLLQDPAGGQERQSPRVSGGPNALLRRPRQSPPVPVVDDDVCRDALLRE